jgi:putative mRNA 3-end processing factor
MSLVFTNFLISAFEYMNLLEFTDSGIYCAPGKFYLDPWKPVDKAVITHAHSDHARWGNKHYLAHHDTIPILKYRLGPDIEVQGIKYGEQISLNGVKLSFHPAGHIPGSAQARIEYKDEVWVFSGDYKLVDDGLSVPFEPMKCHTFISESTFGLPIYKWKPQTDVFSEINDWWRKNAEQGLASVILGYALGKAQRILQNVDHGIGPVYTHGAVENINDIFRGSGIDLKSSQKVTDAIGKAEFRKALIIAPPSALSTPWLKRFDPYSIAIASGWMRLRGARRRRAADRGFVLSDHADWDELNEAVKACGAERVYVTHGYTAAFTRWLNESGLEAYEGKTQYEGELAEINEVTDASGGENEGNDQASHNKELGDTTDPVAEGGNE